MTILYEKETMFPVAKWQVGQEGRKYYLLSRGTIYAVSFDKNEILHKFRGK